MNNATPAANENHLGVREDRQPFCLNLEAEVATGIEPDSASDSKRETREVEVCTTGNMCSSHASQYERLRPRGPIFHQRLMAKVSVKLIKNHTLTDRLGRDLLRVEIRILPCPAYFDQVLFTGAHAERNSIARARVHYDARVHACDMGLNGKAHDGAITHEC